MNFYQVRQGHAKHHELYKEPKNPVLESLLNKVAGLKLATLLKKDPNTGVFLRNLRKF